MSHVDAILDEANGKGRFKVEATDAGGVARVVIAYTDGTGVWSSQDLLFDAATAKWTGAITATGSTRYFVQVVDSAGSIAIDDDKGRYHPLLPPLPLIQGRTLERRSDPPHVRRGKPGDEMRNQNCSAPPKCHTQDSGYTRRNHV